MADIRIIPAAGAINVTGSADFRGDSASTVLFVSGSGNVGVGTSNPISKLHVAGAVKATATTGHVLGTSTDTGRALSILNSGLAHGESYAITLGYASSNHNQAEVTYYLAATGSTSNRLGLGLYNSPDTVSILGTGNVGIGKTNPVARLDAAGDVRTSTRYLISTGTANEDAAIGYWDGSNMRIEAGSAKPMLITSYQGNINLGISGGTTLNVNSSGISVTGTVGYGNASASRGALSYGSSGLITLEATSTNTSIAIIPSGTGNVGIGSTAPSALLDVNGLSIFRGQGTAASGTLTLISADSFIRFNTTGGTADKQKWDVRAISATGFEALEFRTINDANNVFSTKMFIKHGGQVQLNSYGSGTFTGTAARTLAVDSSGNVIEITNTSLGGSGTANRVAYWTDGNTLAADADFFFDGTNVGIGTTSPAYKLDVSGDIHTNSEVYLDNNAYLRFKRTSGGLSIQTLGIPSGTDDVRLLTTGDFNVLNGSLVNLMAVKNGGSIGVGTTGPNNKFHVRDGRVEVESAHGGYGQIWVVSSGSGNESSMTFFVNGYGHGGSTPNGDDAWVVGSDGNGVSNRFWIYDVGTGARRFNIDPSGNTGIGTTSPTRKLHVLSTDDTRGIMVEQTLASSYAEVHLKANREYRVGTGGSTSAAEAANNWYVYDATAAAQRLVINSSGSVGIGTTSPQETLQVQTSIRVEGSTPAYNLYESTTQRGNLQWQTTANYVGIRLFNLDNSNLMFGTNNTERMRIDVNGQVGIGSTAPAYKLDVAGTGRFTSNVYLDSDNYSVGGLYFDRGSSDFSTYVRANGYPAGGFANSAGTKYWLEIGGKGGVHVVLNTDGGAGATENDYDHFTVWQGSNQGDRLFYVTNAGNVTATGNLTVNGKITAREFHTTFVSASIIYQSGSTQFGNSSDDIHVFTGNVGIGVTNPSAKLDIRGGSDGDAMISMGSNSVSGILNAPANMYINADSDNGDANGVIAFGFNRTGYTGGAETMRLLENGNIGIGITNPAPHQGSNALIIKGGGGGRGILELHDGTSGKSVFQNVGGDTYIGQLDKGTGNGNTYLLVSGSGTSANIAMTLLANGNVGIGTTAPDQELHIKVSSGNADVRLTGPTATNYTDFYRGDSAGGVFVYGNTDFSIGTNAGGGSNMFVADVSTGFIGIGTSGPVSRFHVGAEVGDDNSYSYDANTLITVHQTPTSTTTLNDPKEVLMLARQGTGGEAYGAAVTFDLSRYENAGGSNVGSRTRLDFRLAHNDFLTTSTRVMTLLSNGNVGVGVTNPTGSYGKLTVNGSISLLGDQSTKLEIGRYSSGASNSYIKLGANSNSLRITNNTDTADVVYIQNDGNIGIGIAAPSARLDIASIAGANDDKLQRWTYYAPTPTSYYLDLKQTVTSGVVRYNFSMVNADTAYNDVLVLDRGNVGIGTTNPAYKLDVNGTIRGTGLINTGTSTLASQVVIAGNTNSSNTSMYDAYVDGGSSYFQAPPLLVRMDSSATGGIDEAPVALFIHNEDGTNNTWTKLSLGAREAAGAGNSVSIAGIAAQKTSGTANAWASGDLYLWTKSGPDQISNMVLKAGGNVGIGVTNPYSQLSLNNQIGGGTAPVASYTAGSGIGLGQNFFNSYYVSDSDGLGTYPRYFDIVSTGYPDGTNGGSNIRFFTNPIALNSPAVERMRIASTGNVGIGITSPVSRLHVGGTNPRISTGTIEAGSNNSGVYDSDHIIVGVGGSISIGAERRGDYVLDATTATSTTFRSRVNIWSDNEDHVTFGGANTHIVTAWEDFKIWINNDSADAGILHLYNKSGKTEFARLHGDGASWFNGGNVGIGNTDPNGALAFNDDVRTRKIVLWDGAANNNYQFYGFGVESSTFLHSIYDVADRYMWTAGVNTGARNEIMVLKGDGNLGIGTTTPSYKLQVQGTAYINETLYVNGIATIEDRLESIYDMFTGNSDTELEASTSVYGNINFKGATAQGAGSTATTQQGITWQINNYGSTTNYGNQAQLVVGNNGNVGTFMGFFTSDNYGAAPVERLRIQHNGNVGIGTTSPSAKLHVRGGATDNVGLALFENTWSSGGIYYPAATFTNTRGDHSYGIVAGFKVGSSTGGDRPTILFYNDTGAHSWQIGQTTSDTGWGAADDFAIGYRASNDPNSFNDFPTAYLTVKTGGNVGIGVTAPGHKLAVDGRIGGATYSDSHIEFNSSGNTILKANNSVIIGYSSDTYITQGGSVGIGTSGPEYKFHVRGPGITAAAISTGWPSFTAESADQSRIVGYFAAGGNGGTGTAGTGASSVVMLGEYYDARGVITMRSAGGASPSDQGAGYGKDLMVKAGNSDNLNGVIGGRLFLAGGSGYNSGYGTNYGAVIIQPQGGNVGIGTTATTGQVTIRSTNSSIPTLTLNHDLSSQFHGQINTYDPYHGMIFRGYPTAATTYAVTAADVMSFYEYGSDFRFYKKNATPALQLDVQFLTGDGRFRGDVIAYYNFSDQRLKTDIKPLENSLEKILKLQGVSYKWVKGVKEGVADIGLIAQQVEQVVPEVVTEKTNIDDETYKSVNYEHLVGLLIEGMKEQQTRIETLEDRISVLEQLLRQKL